MLPFCIQITKQNGHTSLDDENGICHSKAIVFGKNVPWICSSDSAVNDELIFVATGRQRECSGPCVRGLTQAMGLIGPSIETSGNAHRPGLCIDVDEPHTDLTIVSVMLCLAHPGRASTKQDQGGVDVQNRAGDSSYFIGSSRHCATHFLLTRYSRCNQRNNAVAVSSPSKSLARKG